jgi:GDPmannose 4,6-dehydratase
MKRAVITGITGQTGSYLTELLLNHGYEVHGIVRRSSSFNRSRIEHLRDDGEIYGKSLFLHYADLTDSTTLRRILAKVQPDEIYHLAGQSHVGLSFEIPESTFHETAGATLSLLEICRDLSNPPRIYNASSSEIFGSPEEFPQTEMTPYRPVNPYGCSKAFATSICRVYREAHGLFVCNGITYNHESPRRGENFVTQKIARSAVRIASGSQEVLSLGNLDSARDWGYAPEYVEAMWSMLQHDSAEDYVIATGIATSVRTFALAAFEAAGMTIFFEGEGIDELARDSKTGAIVVRVDAKFFRPTESLKLIGDASRARANLGWIPQISGPHIAQKMVHAIQSSK